MLLGEDEIHLVAACLAPRELGRLAASFKAGRDAARMRMGCTLEGLRPVMTQSHLCSSLGISPDEARALPYELKRNAHAYTHLFHLEDALPVLLRLLGGWGELAQRLAAKEARKRKRDGLDDRRSEAASRRRQKLQMWWEKEMPTPMDRWELPLLLKFLDRTLTAPSIAKVKSEALEARDRRIQLLSALSLVGLELRADSSLCAKFLEGTSRWSAAQVARVMAEMRFLNEHTNHDDNVEKMVQTIRNQRGCFYKGIYRDAVDQVRASTRFPAHWPWL